MITIHIRKDEKTVIPVQAADVIDAAHRCRKAMEQGLTVEKVLDADGVEIAVPIDAMAEPLPNATGDIEPALQASDEAGAAENAKVVLEAAATEQPVEQPVEPAPSNE
jgi:hypothetical protein